jgi:hypothetical protein
MKKFVLMALMGFCLFDSQAKVEIIQKQDDRIPLSMSNVFEFKLKNNNLNKLRVKVEVRKLINDVFENVSNDFSIPRNGQSINGKEDLSLKLSQLTTNDNSDTWVVFKFEDAHGNCVETQKVKIGSSKEKSEDNRYTIINDGGFLKAVLVK